MSGRKFIDKKGRIFGIISVIDIIVIAVVVVLAFAIYTKFFVLENTAVATADSEIGYNVTIGNVRNYISDNIKVGDKIYDSETGAQIGTITDVSVSDAETQLALDDGTYVMAPCENRYDVVVSVDAAGIISDGRYYINRNYELNMGLTKNLCTKYVSFSAVITGIE